MNFYEVINPYPLKKNLIYQSELALKPGALVLAPLKNKNLPAVVLQKVQTPPKAFAVKNIIRRLSMDLEPGRLKWLLWMAKYYHYPLSKTVHLSYPFLPDQLLKVKETKSSEGFLEKTKSLILTKEQVRCVKDIQKNFKGFNGHLIHGVTGSGKTEIFFRLIEPILKKGGSVLVLVPEISLTPQHIKRFSKMFPGNTACLHSGLSVREKKQNWKALLNKNKKILIGPRSALFCPLPELSLIIVDEEHEAHFKQEDKLKYQGRDSAVYLAKCLKIPIILASATPSLESWYNTENKKYFYHSLNKRVFSGPVPEAVIVDMTAQIKNLARPFWMSDLLMAELKNVLRKKEQSAIFLNRRGEKSNIFCKSCGFHFFCSNCDISLTQHKTSYLVCHYCGFNKELPELCPKCGSAQLSSFGLGTQAVEKDLKNLFPSARIARADRDEVSDHKQWADLVESMEKKDIDILVGTQMIAKGLDFSSLNLVGVVLADQGLSRPDFRSAEKHFQLLTQMAGRAGRRNEAGRVILQTFQPLHFVLKALKKGVYQDFVKEELRHRKKHHYPPFGKLTLIRVQSLSEKRAVFLALKLKKYLEKKNLSLKILGPAPAMIFKIRNRYRQHLLLKSSTLSALQEAGDLALQFSQSIKGAEIYINRDPLHL